MLVYHGKEREISRGIFVYPKDSLHGFLEKSVTIIRKNPQKDSEDFLRKPMAVFLEQIFKKCLEDPLTKIPKKIVKRNMEDGQRTFKRNLWKIFRRGIFFKDTNGAIPQGIQGRYNKKILN